MTTVVGEIERHVAIWRLSILELGNLAVVVHIVRTSQIGVGIYFLASGLCRGGQSDS